MNWIKLKSESITSHSTIKIASLGLQLMREELGGGRAMSRAAVIFPGMHIPQEVCSLKGNCFWIWHSPSLDWLQWLVVEQCLAVSTQWGLHVCIHISNRTHCCKDQHMTTEQGPLYLFKLPFTLLFCGIDVTVCPFSQSIISFKTLKWQT